MNNRLKELRQYKGLSLRALSEAVGLDFSTLAYIERGSRNFSAKSQRILADYFGVSVDYLLGSSLDDIFNNFINNHYGDFVRDAVDSEGNAYEQHSATSATAIKFDIVKILQGIDDAPALEHILESAKIEQAKLDFKEDSNHEK